MSTLADAILKESYAKHTLIGEMVERPIGEIRNAITVAHRFVLDKPMSAFMADLSTAVYRTAHKKETLDSMRRSALLPHDVTWVEFDGREFRRRVVELGISRTLDDTPLADLNEIPATWGMLMERHPRIPTAVRLSEFVSGEPGSPGVMPVTQVWNSADAPLPWANVCHKSGMIAHGVMGYICPYIGTLLPKRMPDSWKRRVVCNGDGFDTHMMAVETAGITRYALAFLAALSEMPATFSTVSTGGKKFYVRGQYRRFLDHTVVRLNIPARRSTIKVARHLIASIHMRAHKVREHWRLYQRKADFACEHLWGAVDDNNHAYCTRCPSWRTRIVEHVRGDASLGWVQHSYKVGHKET